MMKSKIAGTGRLVRIALASGMIGALAGGVLLGPAQAADSDFEWGFYDLHEVSWSTKVPGYDPHIVHGRRLSEGVTGVHFSMEWPRSGLVAGHAGIKTPFVVGAAESLAIAATGSTVLKAASWARTLALSVNNFKQIVPMGVCKGRSGKLKEEVGQFDPENRRCYIPRYDGLRWWIEETNDLKVLVATPMLATWTPKAEAHKHRRALSSGYVSYDNYGGTICRAAFQPPTENLLKSLAGALELDKAFKIGAKTELLVGRVYKADHPLGGVCVFAYKEPIFGKRYPVVSREYEVLTVETDQTFNQDLREFVRNRRVALRHEATGKCLALGSRKTPALVDCFSQRADPSPMLELTGSGLLRAWNADRCLNRIGRDFVAECGDASNSDNGWFLNGQGRLRGSFGSCLAVKGGKVKVVRGCRMKPVSKDEKWKVLTYRQLDVRQSGQDNRLPLKVSITGRPTETCGERTKYCTAWVLFGTKMTVQVHDERNTTFSKWTDGPCRNKTSSRCQFVFADWKNDILAFRTDGSATDAELMAATGFMFVVRRSDKCVDDTGQPGKGKPIHAWDCSAKNKNQRWVMVPKDKKAKDPTIFEIRSQRSGLCLDVAGSKKGNGVPVVTWPCNGGANQAWEVYKVDPKNHWFSLRAKHTDKCLDLAQGKKNNGARFHQWSCNPSNANQRFKIGG
jgi:hypothetical protein